jgi:isopentenyl-diphosphate delta-isomerase
VHRGNETAVESEEIVLLGPDGHAVGTAPKLASHHRSTPFHLAFSCYLVDGAGRVLVTQRAPSKHTWPSAWTNSFCGHLAPRETLRDAVRRRACTELGLGIEEPILVLPTFRYRAVMPNGVMENEQCPVVRARAVGNLSLNPAEVAEAHWAEWADCLELAQQPDASPWFRNQVGELAALGAPEYWPEASPDLLPPALAW